MAKSKAELLAEKMAAKRVGQTAFEAGKAPVVEITPAVPEQQTQEEPKAEEVAQVPAVEEEPAKEEQKPAKAKKQTKSSAKQPKKTAPEGEGAKVAPPADVLALVQKKKRVRKKTNAYYLSVTNIEKLAKAAEEADTVPSTLLDEILTAVFSSWEK